MSERHSTARARPAKPYPEFPLFPHATGRWAKKIRGKLHYFGPWADPDAALKNYLEQKEALHAGRAPRPAAGAATVKDAANAFLNHKRALLEAGELSARSWDEYRETAEVVVARFGKGRLVEDLRPDDFAQLRAHLAKGAGPVRLGNIIQRVRSLFKHAFEAELTDRPVRFGPGFKRPARKVLRVHRAGQGPKLFAADEVRRLADAAAPALRAMILLGINCGFGYADCGALRRSAVDLEGGWVDFPRPKTGVARRCPLWPETVSALREALARRPRPKSAEGEGLMLLTREGTSWTAAGRGGFVQVFRRLQKKVGVPLRKGVGFYALRHTFRTVADETKDQPAVDFIMGHEVPHMSTVYRETIGDDRLRAVADHVRRWLFAADGATRQEAADWSPVHCAVTVPPLSAGMRRLVELAAELPAGLGEGFAKLERATYRQVVVTARLMRKGWRLPYCHFGYGTVTLCPPARAASRRRGKFVRVLKDGRITVSE